MSELVGSEIAGCTITRLWWQFDGIETYEAISNAFGARSALEVHAPITMAQTEGAQRSARCSALLGDMSTVMAPMGLGQLPGGRPYILRVLPKTGARLVELISGPMAVARALAITRSLATALDSIHHRGYAICRLPCETVFVEETPAGEHVRLFDFRYAIVEHVTDGQRQVDLRHSATILYELASGTRVTNRSIHDLRRVPKSIQALLEQAFDGEFETAADFAAALSTHPAAAPSLPVARLIDK